VPPRSVSLISLSLHVFSLTVVSVIRIVLTGCISVLGLFVLFIFVAA
jgi:hypothetical protein